MDWQQDDLCLYQGNLHRIEDLGITYGFGKEVCIRRHFADGRYRPSFWIFIDEIYPPY